jgi:homospermidine synthase
MTQTIHARLDGPLVMIGFGSIGRGTLPLIERHIDFDRTAFTVIEPSADQAPCWPSTASATCSLP